MLRQVVRRGCRPSNRAYPAIAVVVFISSLAGAAAAPDAEPARIVRAGAYAPGTPGAPYEYLRFYPSLLTVREGELVSWEFRGAPPYDGLHTVTFSPNGQSDVSFVRGDEMPGTLAWDESMWMGTGCGRAGQEPCVIDDTERTVSSGVPLFDHSPFRARIELPVGIYAYYCAVHPSMHGAIQVVAPDQQVPSQAEVDAGVEQEVLADTAKADALVQANAEPVSAVVDGRRVWDVLVGDSTDDHSVAVWSFMPPMLDVAPGDRVRFLIPDTVRDEVHTVSFPQAVHRGYFEDPGVGLLGFQPRCDPDGADEGLPGFLWPWFEAPCPQGTPEWVLSPWNTEQQRAAGDAVITPLTLHNSGILAAPAAPKWLRGAPPGSGRTFPSEFHAAFPATGSYPYTCNIHLGGMTGSIRVG